jgi:glycosyltransferase involved in cell wall biosynthesis
MEQVAAFTDTYLPTVNGVSYTIASWRERWERAGGRMDVVYPNADGHAPADGEHPVGSLPFPFYDGFRLGTPRIPKGVRDAELVHAHTPFSLGLGGLRLARAHDLPLVASYHTPTSEYASYVSPTDSIASLIGRLSETYERWFFGRADAVLAPSAATKDHLLSEVGVETTVEVVPNGVDTERFRPVDPEGFLDRYDLRGERPLIGYTGRHGYEKHLSELVEAAALLDVTVVFGGDGPAHPDLERRADDLDVDARFLGFLDREEMAAFYSALDAFAFPSPVETQGLVALEANACGTPVVGANAGALADTIDDGETGYHYESGNVEDFRDAIRRTLAERETLRETCLARRDTTGVEHAVEKLRDVYDSIR